RLRTHETEGICGLGWPPTFWQRDFPDVMQRQAAWRDAARDEPTRTAGYEDEGRFLEVHGRADHSGEGRLRKEAARGVRVAAARAAGEAGFARLGGCYPKSQCTV